MSIGVRVSGAWKDVNAVSVRVGGAWKPVSQAYVKVSGVWQPLLGALPAVNYLTVQTNNNSGPYTFSGVAATPVAADAFLVFAAAQYNGAARSFVSGTVNGNPATELVAVGSGGPRVAFYGLAIPSTSSVDIGFTLSGSTSHGAMAAWVLTGLSSTSPISSGTATATASGGTAAVGTTVAVAANGITLAAAMRAANTSATWSGITEDFDTTIESGSAFSGGTYLPSSNDSSHSITATFASTSNACSIAMVSFR